MDPDTYHKALDVGPVDEVLVDMMTDNPMCLLEIPESIFELFEKNCLDEDDVSDERCSSTDQSWWSSASSSSFYCSENEFEIPFSNPLVVL